MTWYILGFVFISSSKLVSLLFSPCLVLLLLLVTQSFKWPSCVPVVRVEPLLQPFEVPRPTPTHTILFSLSLVLAAAAGAAVKSTYPHTPPHLALKPSCHVCGIFEGCFGIERSAKRTI